MIFKGSGVALVTPFNSDGNVNFEKLDELITYHIANNTDALIICGTTGEASTMTKDEKITAIKCTIETVKENMSSKKVPVIVGTGSNNTSSAIEMSILAEKLGADGLLVVTPYYNKTTQNRLNRIL